MQSTGSFLKYTSMAFQMIGAILVFVFLGRYIDQHFLVSNQHSITKDLVNRKSFPVYTFVGTILGVGSSLYFALKSLKK